MPNMVDPDPEAFQNYLCTWGWSLIGALATTTSSISPVVLDTMPPNVGEVAALTLHMPTMRTGQSASKVYGFDSAKIGRSNWRRGAKEGVGYEVVDILNSDLPPKVEGMPMGLDAAWGGETIGRINDWHELACETSPNAVRNVGEFADCIQVPAADLCRLSGLAWHVQHPPRIEVGNSVPV